MNHTIKTIEIKVVQGTIEPEDNELETEYPLFYWANFVPHYEGKMIFIIGECGFDKDFEKKRFVFKYNDETDTITFCEKYRMCICSPEIYGKYYLNIRLPEATQTLAIPWIRFPRTKDGVSIPQLVQRILGKIPAMMIF